MWYIGVQFTYLYVIFVTGKWIVPQSKILREIHKANSLFDVCNVEDPISGTHFKVNIGSLLSWIRSPLSQGQIQLHLRQVGQFIYGEYIDSVWLLLEKSLTNQLLSGQLRNKIMTKPRWHYYKYWQT